MTTPRTMIRTAAVSTLSLGFLALGTVPSAQAVSYTGMDPVNGGEYAAGQKCDVDNDMIPDIDGLNLLSTKGKVVGFAYNCDNLNEENQMVQRSIVLLPSADAAKVRHNVSIKMVDTSTGKTLVSKKEVRVSGTFTVRANSPYGVPVKVTVVQGVPGALPDATRTIVLGDDED